MIISRRRQIMITSAAVSSPLLLFGCDGSGCTRWSSTSTYSPAPVPAPLPVTLWGWVWFLAQSVLVSAAQEYALKLVKEAFVYGLNSLVGAANAAEIDLAKDDARKMGINPDLYSQTAKVIGRNKLSDTIHNGAKIWYQIDETGAGVNSFYINIENEKDVEKSGQLNVVIRPIGEEKQGVSLWNDGFNIKPNRKMRFPITIRHKLAISGMHEIACVGLPSGIRADVEKVYIVPAGIRNYG